VSERKSAIILSMEPMEAEDLPEVLPIAADPQGVAWTKGVFEKELATSFSHNWICRARLGTGKGFVAGFVSFWLIAGEVQLQNLAVRADLRRQGIGTRLMEEMFRTARARGVRRVTLEVRESNEAAAALYEQFGFAAAGRRPGYYHECGEAAVILWADLERNAGAENGQSR